MRGKGLVENGGGQGGGGYVTEVVKEREREREKRGREGIELDEVMHLRTQWEG